MAPALEGGYELLTVIQTASATVAVSYGAPNGPRIVLRALPYTV